MRAAFVLILSLLGAAACSSGEVSSPATAEEQRAPASAYELRMTLTHDPAAFTQGLVYHRGSIIESTGGDSSWIARYDVASGVCQKEVVLHKDLFGEGITVLNDKLYQLTWKSKVGFVYDANTFEKLAEFTYDFEGWGITHDHQHLIISDGTDKLHYFDPLTLQEVATKSVKHHGRSASKLNELEFIDGYLYANQWETNHLLKIDTAKADIIEVIDLSALVRESKRLSPSADVLNGIAYNAETGDVYVTGKLWPRLFVIRLKEE